MNGKIVVTVLLSVMAVLLQGCPPEGGWPLPPFDATGTYEGTWQGRTNEVEGEGEVEGEIEEVQVVAACPLTIELTQDLTKPYPGDHGVSGMVTIDYSCIELPEWAQNQETPAPSEVIVSGLLTDDGKLTLASGGCGIGLCVLLTLAGEGVDVNEDGLMDTYSGAWSYIILLAGVPPFGVSGTFEVDFVEPEVVTVE